MDESYGLNAVIGAVAAAGAEALSPLLGSSGDVAMGTEGINGAAAETEESTATDTGWKLGDFKSDQTWQNQMTKRGWTIDQIDDAIQNGEQTDICMR